jgi:hypothetical protein
MAFVPAEVSEKVWAEFTAKHGPATDWLIIFADELPADRIERAEFYAANINSKNDADVILAVMTIERLRGASEERARWHNASDDMLRIMRQED